MRIIQQRRVTGDLPPSTTSTPTTATKTAAENESSAHAPPPSVPSQADAMDVDGPAAKETGGAPSVAVQGSSPALGTGGFSSGGLATRSHDEGRQKAGGLSIKTPSSAEGGPLVRSAIPFPLRERP